MNARVLKRMMKQKAVYWAAPVNDGYGGFAYDVPVEIDCRWEEKQEKFTDINGEDHLSQAVIYVNSDVIIGGQLSLMLLADLSSSSMPEDNDGFEIKAFSKVPGLKADSFLRKIWL